MKAKQVAQYTCFAIWAIVALVVTIVAWPITVIVGGTVGLAVLHSYAFDDSEGGYY